MKGRVVVAGGHGVVADEAASGERIGAGPDGLVLVGLHFVANEVGGHELAAQLGVVVEKLVEEARGVSRALTMAGDDDGPALVVMGEVVLEGGFYVSVGEVEGGLTVGSFLVEEGIERGLTVARRVDAAGGVECRSLVADGAFVGVAVQLFFAEVGIPGGTPVVGGGVNEENVGGGSCLFIVQTGLLGHGIGRIAAGGQGGPEAVLGVVGAGRGGVGGEVVAGL